MEPGEQFVMTTLISMLLRLSAECLIKTSEFLVPIYVSWVDPDGTPHPHFHGKLQVTLAFLKILVQTPFKKQLGPIASRVRFVRRWRFCCC